MQSKELDINKIQPIREYTKRFDFTENGLADTGRPSMYSNKEDLQKKILEYFNIGCTIKIKKLKDGQILEVPVPTITGMAAFLGFASRQSMYDFANADEKINQFSYTVKRAMLFIEREYEEMLSTGNVVGAIFALKNMGRSDRLDINQTTIDVTQLWNESQKQGQQMKFGVVEVSSDT